MYDSILAKILTFLGSFNIMKTMVKYLTKLRKLELTEELIEGEAWRILIRTGQKYFPAKQRKEIREKIHQGIRVVIMRFDDDIMVRGLDSKLLPILGKEDPLSLKLIRDSHTGNTPIQ